MYDKEANMLYTCAYKYTRTFACAHTHTTCYLNPEEINSNPILVTLVIMQGTQGVCWGLSTETLKAD